VDRGDRTRPAEAAGRYEDLGAGAILFTDVDVEGQLEGFGPTRSSASPKRSISRSSPAAASRRWTTSWFLRDAGAGAVVVGSALYEGRFSLADARDAL